ncbi:TapY2 family type IVa secretion system protein [Pseudocolwellia agarivorans]|uniref:TapY2 family type IVa secretion system protein n=1 Tax=Pseudocolwellia agarivorans TaxID=1911682 RepID=UPI003F88344F
MRLFSNLLVLLSIYSLFHSSSILAKKPEQFKEVKKVNLKCYVELIGGQTTILYHYHLPESDKKLFSDWLLQKYKDSQGNSEVRSVYRVNECVEIKDKFKDSTANSLEKELDLDK